MRKTRARWELCGTIFVLAAGVLLHFLYAWTGNHAVVGAFSAVNESTWEHMKLVFVPLFLFSFVEVFFVGRSYSNFLACRGFSAIVGAALVPILFYTYTGVLGRHLLWADIAVFAVSVIAAFLLDDWLLRTGRFNSGWQQVLGLLFLWGLAFLFVFWTYRPPHLALFLDPVTLRSGI